MCNEGGSYVKQIRGVFSQPLFSGMTACPESWMEVPKGVVADEPDSELQVMYI